MEEKILVIIPAYNEEESLEHSVSELMEAAPHVDFIIVNDGSADKTAQVCRDQGYNLLDMPLNTGLTSAFQCGMRYAYEQGYDYALQYDADGQHIPRYIDALIKEARTGKDIVIGSRYVEEKRPVSARTIGSLFIIAMIKLTTGKKICDPTSGFRIFNKKMIEEFARRNDLSPEPDTVAYLMHKGASVSEIQVEMRERFAGASYLTATKSIAYMFRIGVSILLIQWFR